MPMNQVNIMGKLGNQPQLKKTQAGTSMLELRIAVTERRGDATETHWFPVSVYGSSAEKVAPLLKQGSEVAVYGKAWTRTITGADNKQHTIFQVVANVIRVIQALPPRESMDHAWIAGEEHA